MTITIHPTPDQLDRLVAFEFGPEASTSAYASRYFDVARDIAARRTPATRPETAAYLETLQHEADEAEERRVAEVRRSRQETADRWAEFDQKRAAPSATPEGLRDFSFRDEPTGKLIRIRIPADFVLSA